MANCDECGGLTDRYPTLFEHKCTCVDKRAELTPDEVGQNWILAGILVLLSFTVAIVHFLGTGGSF